MPVHFAPKDKASPRVIQLMSCWYSSPPTKTYNAGSFATNGDYYVGRGYKKVNLERESAVAFVSYV